MDIYHSQLASKILESLYGCPLVNTSANRSPNHQLSNPSRVSSVTNSLLTIQAQLGHQTLAKMQKLVPSLSKLSSLSCESCPLGNISTSHFLTICALQTSRTSELVALPHRKFVVGYRWIYTVKINSHGKLDRLKDRLMARVYPDF